MKYVTGAMDQDAAHHSCNACITAKRLSDMILVDYQLKAEACTATLQGLGAEEGRTDLLNIPHQFPNSLPGYIHIILCPCNLIISEAGSAAKIRARTALSVVVARGPAVLGGIVGHRPHIACQSPQSIHTLAHPHKGSIIGQCLHGQHLSEARCLPFAASNSMH